MNARELLKAGKLHEAIQAIAAEIRDHPSDQARRTFLFELLCFAGEYDRAEKHLAVLAQEGPKSEMGALLYRGALAAERMRQDMFSSRECAGRGPAEPVTGTLNGQPFQSLEDADPRIGARLEVFAAGAYLWMPLVHIASIDIQPPRRLRDLLWVPAMVRTGPGFQGREVGEVLVPALSPLSFRHPDDGVRLGRLTVWEEDEEGNPVPYGQKTLSVDGEEIPLLEVRSLRVEGRPASATAEAGEGN
jgi:type VI secretion system protein ImpE